jgi:membrane protein implicated in regulation of membrane protease activity
MKRLWVALSAIAVLMLLTWITIDDQKFRLATLAILAMFAIRTWSHSRKLESEQSSRPGEGEKDRRE